jgi:hypothetical protein
LRTTSRNRTAQGQANEETSVVFHSRFRLCDESLQRELLARVARSAVPHAVEPDGTLRYASENREEIEDEFICSLRQSLFPEWGIFTLEGDGHPRPRTTALFREYMLNHGIPFVEEAHDGFAWFLVAQEHDSFAWDVPDLDEG